MKARELRAFILTAHARHEQLGTAHSVVCTWMFFLMFDTRWLYRDGMTLQNITLGSVFCNVDSFAYVTEVIVVINLTFEDSNSIQGYGYELVQTCIPIVL